MRGFARTAVTEHMLSKQPITRLEAINLYGMQDLTGAMSKMKKEGYVIERTVVPMERAVKRLQGVIAYKPPRNLPTQELKISEYVLTKGL